MQVNNWLFFAQSLLFPRHCFLCGSPLLNGDLCGDCVQDLPLNRAACPLCALPLAAGNGSLCGRCTARRPPFAASRVPLLYEPPVDRLVSALKFHHQLHLVAPLARLFCEGLGNDQPLPEIVLPVPLHPSRLRERGFNQSLELARRVAAELSLPLDRQGCRRVRATPPQSGLDLRSRRQNLRAAFVAERTLAGRGIALFDDVVTSGATVTAVTRALLRAGAERVEVWALARTPEP